MIAARREAAVPVGGRSGRRTTFSAHLAGEATLSGAQRAVGGPSRALREREADHSLEPVAFGGTLIHRRRRLADGELLFIVNTSTGASAGGQVMARENYGSVERWDPETGEMKPYPAYVDVGIGMRQGSCAPGFWTSAMR